MASSAIMEGVGTLVCFDERFPDMHYTIAVETAPNGGGSAHGSIETLPRRASVQIELEPNAMLELQNGEAIGIVFGPAASRLSNAAFVATGPIAGA